ncbi:hypothetical protein Q8A73_010826 [Channa argus]|nr:hypothetical protein Q8A73_010826 [Channa argus]
MRVHIRVFVREFTAEGAALQIHQPAALLILPSPPPTIVLFIPALLLLLFEYSLTTPHLYLRIRCLALRPCAEEALAGISMGAVLASIPTTPSTTDLPPPRCPTITGTLPSPSDGRRH